MASIVIYIRHLMVRGGGEKVCLALASTLAADPNNDVRVVTPEDDLDPAALAKYFDIDLNQVQFIRAEAGPVLSRLRSHPRVPGLIRNVADELAAARRLRQLDCDLFINNTHQSYVGNIAARGVVMCMFPSALDLRDHAPRGVRRIYLGVMQRLIRLLLHRGHDYAIDSYDTVLANSDYTAGWVRRLWRRDAAVLHPFCTAMHDPDVPREKIILNVGRFFPDFAETHHKRQDFLLERFLAHPELAEQGWRLHFAGGLLDDPASRDYLESLRRRAGTAPVEYHVDASFEDLRRLYNRAAVYWHATGFGHDENEHPEKHEHFGISTVEAMSTGCIPIVIDSAGQREIVTDGVNGYLWSTAATIEDRTVQVAARSEAELEQLRAAAADRARDFDRASFEARVRELLTVPEAAPATS